MNAEDDFQEGEEPEEICENCGYPLNECDCGNEEDPEDELFRENPLKAIWIKLKEIDEKLEGGEIEGGGW